LKISLWLRVNKTSDVEEIPMEYRFLGKSGLQVSALSFGTMTFGGTEMFQHIGNTQIEDARRLVDICFEAGINLFDTANMYSLGASEKILGEAIGKERRHKALIATKVFFRMGPEIHDIGLSRRHIIQACEESLKRLNTDYIDLYQAHNFDALTPLEETMEAFDQLIRDGKVRYIGNSNFTAWQSTKANCIAERKGYQRLVSQQVYYSLLARDLEMELIPCAVDQQMGSLIWSPLSFGLLSGKYKRGTPPPEESRLAQLGSFLPADMEKLYQIQEVLEKIAAQRSKTVPQVALNWVLQRPTVSSIIIGARNEKQLRENIGAIGWNVTQEEMKQLDEASRMPDTYPTWHQRRFALERNPHLQ